MQIERLNACDNPEFFLSRSVDALPILQEVAHPNLFLLYDVFHMQMTEGCHETGTREINFAHFFRQLDALGFEGWIGCKYNPSVGTQESLEWMTAYRSETFAACGH
ncbi:MAG TPA: hypothetical protein VM912_03180 [Terriglobales bacterium]|nr:hypothetical protein [Terriglobales bacterium]